MKIKSCTWDLHSNSNAKNFFLWQKKWNTYCSDFVQNRNNKMRILSIFKTFCKNTKCFQYRENISEVFLYFLIENPSLRDYFCIFHPSLKDSWWQYRLRRCALFCGLKILILSSVGLQIRRNGKTAKSLACRLLSVLYLCIMLYGVTLNSIIAEYL